VIDLVYLNHKSINDIMSNKFKVGMPNPVVSATGKEGYQCATFVL
jgi:hypothetical protein